MTGLETIIQLITEDAGREAEELLSDARKKAEQITETARKEAEEQKRAILSAGQAEAEDIRERARSAAQLERRSLMLRFKQEMIDEVIDSTRISLENAPDGEYFSTLTRLAVRFAQPGKAVMRLNGKDLKRLPDGFEASLSAAVPGTEITVSPVPADIESGFLLIYGGIDINCTFRSLFEDSSDRLRDAVGSILFPQS